MDMNLFWVLWIVKGIKIFEKREKSEKLQNVRIKPKPVRSYKYI